MKKVDTIELTQKLNEFCRKHPNKNFTREEINEELQKLGFNSQVRGSIIPKFFPYEKIGSNHLYTVPKQPIYKSAIEAVYEKFRRATNKSRESRKIEIVSQNSEEQALAFLTSKGYQIRKCVGFDLERFQKEQPVLYRKYLKYETV